MAKPTVLVVDDDLFFRRLFTDILAEGDLYALEALGSGAEALARIEDGGVDLVLSDMLMPGVCGLDLLRQSRCFHNPPEVILVTSNATIDTAIRALKNGARDYLVKPCRPEQLKNTVRSCLDQRRLLSENSLLRTQVKLYERGLHLAFQLDIDDLFRKALTVLLSEAEGFQGLAFTLTETGVDHCTTSAELSLDIAHPVAEKLKQHLEKQDAPFRLPATELDGLPNKFLSAWVCPLKAGGHVRGAVVLLDPRNTEALSSALESPVLFLAEQLSLGFENACQYRSSQELIYSDDLTGLYNHRYLHVALEQEIRRSDRYGLDFSVAFIDLDRFKEVNDRFGHLVGSGILKEVGQLLQSCVRDSDLLFRYGGDEFTALLVETNSQGAGVVAERIRNRIAGHAFGTGSPEPCHLTATVGHATYPLHASDQNDLVEMADKAMYQGKIRRNATCCASELPSQ